MIATPVARLAGLLSLAFVSIAGACSSLVSDVPVQGDIAVNITQRQGQPIPGIRVILFRGTRQVAYATSDDGGRVLFAQVPRATYGVFAIMNEDVRGVSALGSGPDGNLLAPIVIRGGDDTTVTVRFLKVGTGVLNGTVVDNDALPLSGVRVFLFTPTGTVDSTRSDGLGRFSFTQVPYGPAGAAAIPPDTIAGPAAAPVIRQGMFFDAGHVESRTFVINRCLGSITARVLDQNDAPVPNYPVVLFTSSATVRTEPTGNAGTIAFPTLLCNEYGVAAAANPGFSVNYVRGQGFLDGLRITALGQTFTPTLRVTRNP